MNPKEILGGLAVIIGLVGYIPYFISFVRGTTKPHAFSWFVWGLVYAVAFAVQITVDAGPSSWLLGVDALVNFSVFGFTLAKGYRDFLIANWIALSLAILAVILWRLSSAPLVAAIFVTIADATGFIPTFRKGFMKPYEENLTTYILCGIIAPLFAIAALTSHAVASWLYLSSVVLTAAGFVVMTALRRKAISGLT